eukprot:4178582-Ditylum_brightwellii.AAC.1
MGVGGKEIQQMLSIGKHYDAKVLSRVEEDVGSVLRQASNECTKKAIELEIKMTLDKKHELWKLLKSMNESLAGELPLTYDKWKSLDDDAKPRISITVCYNMGW